MAYDTISDVPIRSTAAHDLVRSGFTQAQASAIAQVVEASAGGAVDRLGRELARWHVYLAMYLLIQLGIVLLVVLMAQATRDPIPPPWAGHAGLAVECICGDTSSGSAAWAVERARLIADRAWPRPTAPVGPPLRLLVPVGMRDGTVTRAARMSAHLALISACSVKMEIRLKPTKSDCRWTLRPERLGSTKVEPA